MASITHSLTWVYNELGLRHVRRLSSVIVPLLTHVQIHETGRNAYLIILARTLRMLAYGTTFVLGTQKRGNFFGKQASFAHILQHCSSPNYLLPTARLGYS